MPGASSDAISSGGSILAYLNTTSSNPNRGDQSGRDGCFSIFNCYELNLLSTPAFSVVPYFIGNTACRVFLGSAGNYIDGATSLQIGSPYGIQNVFADVIVFSVYTIGAINNANNNIQNTLPFTFTSNAANSIVTITGQPIGFD